MTRRMLLVPVTGDLIMVDVPDLDTMRTAIRCEWVEHVRADDGWSMLVDDEGLLTGKQINARASAMYGTHVHGHPIVGDVLLGAETTDRSDWVDTPEAEARAFVAQSLAAAISGGWS